MKLPNDVIAFSNKLASFADLMDSVMNADDWGPLDTAEAAENLLNEYLTILENHR